MFKFKNKIIYLSLFFLLLPCTQVLAVNSDSVYVWSPVNNKDVTSTEMPKEETNPSRQLLKSYFSEVRY